MATFVQAWHDLLQVGAFQGGLKALRKVFEGFDTDSDGRLTVVQWQRAMWALGVGQDDDVAHALFRVYAPEGLVSYPEILSGGSPPKQLVCGHDDSWRGTAGGLRWTGGHWRVSGDC